MIHKLHQHTLSLNIKHFLGLDLLLLEILTHVFTKKLLFLLLHNHALNLFLIQKGHMGNKLSLSLLLVSLVLLSHFFHHILLFLEQEVDPDNIKAIMDWPTPKDVSNIISFMCMEGYYRRFIKGFSKICCSITSLQKKGVKFIWTSECEERFQ
jgi:hypothetical protein